MDMKKGRVTLDFLAKVALACVLMALLVMQYAFCFDNSIRTSYYTFQADSAELASGVIDASLEGVSLTKYGLGRLVSLTLEEQDENEMTVTFVTNIVSAAVLVEGNTLILDESERYLIEAVEETEDGTVILLERPIENLEAAQEARIQIEQDGVLTALKMVSLRDSQVGVQGYVYSFFAPILGAYAQTIFEYLAAGAMALTAAAICILIAIRFSTLMAICFSGLKKIFHRVEHRYYCWTRQRLFLVSYHGTSCD